MLEHHATLQAQGGRSLDWLSRNLDRFAPLAGGRPDEFRLKAFTELAFLYSYLHQWPDLTFGDAVRPWFGFIEAWCAVPALAQMPRKQRNVALGYLLPYLMLRATGYRCDYHEETLEVLQRSNDLKPVELVPYRALEREHALWRSGLLRREPAWKRLADATLLRRPPSPLGVDDEGAYAITHTLFYLTDLGNRPAPLTPEQRQDAVDLVETTLVHYWRIGNWDLVGELLTNLNCLDAGASAIYAGASSAYVQAWGTDGAVLAKRLAPDSDQGTVTSDEDTFRARYHPTLVGVLYCATALNGIRRRSTCEVTCTV